MGIIKPKKLRLVILVLSLNLFIISSLFTKNFNNTNNNNNDNFTSPITYDNLIREVNTNSKVQEGNLLRWEEVVSSISFFEISSKLSYQGQDLVKIRDDNKIECIVKSEDADFTPHQIEIFSNYGIEAPFEGNIIYIPLIFNGISFLTILEELNTVPRIIYIEPNFYDELMYIPNDTYYATYQYDMRLIGMETAWDYQLGSSSVKVAILDTGIDYTHPDLSANYLSLGYDWVNSDPFPMDDNNHGSHVAGTIAAVINNARGVAGTSQVSIFAEKILDASGYGSHADFRSGMMHAVDQGADIISYSGGGSDSATKREAVDYAINNGVMVIAAAGNDNVNTPLYPAAYPGVIAVAATDQNDLKASFSNYGTWIDVAAPGVDIASTGAGNTYWLMDGTSMATPHVSGLAALIKSEYPSFTSSEIESTIIDNVVDLGTPGFDIYYGWGRISALNIFETPHKPFNPLPSSGTTGITTNPTLSVDVTDPYGDVMNVYFYDASDNSLVDIDYNVVSGGRASVSWFGLNDGTTYNWYAIANDGIETATSKTWSFTTNYRPNIPANPIPSNNIYGISLNPPLSVQVSDPDGDPLSVSFYNAYDNSLIGTDGSTPSGGTASISWLSLSDSTNYQWYAVANDGMVSTISSTWVFTTNYPPDSPINPTPVDSSTRVITNLTLSVGVTDFEGSVLEVSFYDASGDMLIGTDSGVLSGTTASVPWVGLADGTTYNWYVVINDGLISTTSSTWSFTTNFAPDTIINLSPVNGTSRVAINPTLRVNVTDPDGDSMNVSFYNAFDDSLIGIDTNVASGGTASIVWDNLSEGTEYSWYAIAHDGIASTTSPNWNFTTNYAPDLPTDSLPTIGSINVSLNAILSLNISDPDGDIMNVSFYNGLDHNLIGIDINIPSGGNASISWLELPEGITYSWYVVIFDGLTSTNSSTWTFTTFIDIPIWNPAPSPQIIEYGNFLEYTITASDFSGINTYWINDTSNFNIDNNGTITSSGVLAVGSYIVEVRAYDPFDNNCTAIISITVEDTINPSWIIPLTDQSLELGEGLLYDIDAFDLSGIILYWINHTSNLTIDNNGIITNITILIPGTYWLEVKAYDPYGNYCTGIIIITVNSPEEISNVIPPTIPTIPGYNIFFLIGIILILSLFKIKKKTRY